VMFVVARKEAFRPPVAMSALTRKRTCAVRLGMSAKGQKRSCGGLWCWNAYTTINTMMALGHNVPLEASMRLSSFH
jgi:hypothetical protein